MSSHGCACAQVKCNHIGLAIRVFGLGYDLYIYVCVCVCVCVCVIRLNNDGEGKELFSLTLSSFSLLLHATQSKKPQGFLPPHPKKEKIKGGARVSSTSISQPPRFCAPSSWPSRGGLHVPLLAVVAGFQIQGRGANHQKKKKPTRCISKTLEVSEFVAACHIQLSSFCCPLYWLFMAGSRSPCPKKVP